MATKSITHLFSKETVERISKMLKFLLMILASSLLTQAVPVPATTNCSGKSEVVK